LSKGYTVTPLFGSILSASFFCRVPARLHARAHEGERAVQQRRPPAVPRLEPQQQRVHLKRLPTLALLERF
jgi:hypothetical protein